MYHQPEEDLKITVEIKLMRTKLENHSFQPAQWFSAAEKKLLHWLKTLGFQKHLHLFHTCSNLR